MKFSLLPFQVPAVEHAVSFFADAPIDSRQLYAAPTGVGKSVIELWVQQRCAPTWIVTPRDEIVQGMLDKLGKPDTDPLDSLIATPIKLRNRLLDGRIGHLQRVIFDEVHHHSAESWQQVGLLTGLAPSVGYTATPYRGSPRATKEFRDRWGEPLWIITYQEAVDGGYISMPTFDVLPLVDDDVIEVKGGDFSITSIESETVDRLGDLAEQARKWYTNRWDRPTIFAMPGSASCERLQRELAARGMPSAIVDCSTKYRSEVFDAVCNGVLALLHINIVTEGVDLPLRRLVDCAPTLSPVKWVQQLGRITRKLRCPHHLHAELTTVWECSDCRSLPAPEYICTNRNLLRHSFALDGCVPIRSVVAAERLFPPTSRGHSRAAGLEALGRFKSTTTKLLNGGTLYVYAVSATIGPIVTDYCCIVHPTMEPIWASRVHAKAEDGARTWGSWRLCDTPTDIRGFGSLSSKDVSEKQRKWWDRSASSFGLDPSQELTRKSFSALPVLSDTGVHFR